MSDPQATKKKSSKKLYIFIALFGALTILAGLAPKPKYKEGSDTIGVQVYCENAIERSLKSPASASFHGGHTNKLVKYNGDGVYRYASYVDSENSFGGTVRTHFVCEVKREGKNSYNLIDLSFKE